MKNTISNVAFFRGHDVINGEVSITEHEYRDFLDEIYGTVEIAGMTYDAGRVLEAVDPIAFRVGMGDYESEIQSELEEAIVNEDYSEIEWIEDPEDEDE